MAEPDPFRAEVALKFGQDRIILRCNYRALGKMLPYLEDVPTEVVERRHRWLKRQQAILGRDRDVPPVERWDWNHHLLGALAAREVETVARCVAILAEEHQPEIDFARVMDVSPSWGLLHGPLQDLVWLFHYKPGEEPDLVRDGRPFAALARLSATLSRLLPRTASVPRSSAT